MPIPFPPTTSPPSMLRGAAINADAGIPGRPIRGSPTLLDLCSHHQRGRPAHLLLMGQPQPPPSSIRHRDTLLGAIHLPTELLPDGVADLLLGVINGRARHPTRAAPTTQPICSTWKVGDLLAHDLHGRWSTVDRPLPRAPSSTPSATPPSPEIPQIRHSRTLALIRAHHRPSPTSARVPHTALHPIRVRPILPTRNSRPARPASCSHLR
jgi:hypothetical protein